MSTFGKRNNITIENILSQVVTEEDASAFLKHVESAIGILEQSQIAVKKTLCDLSNNSNNCNLEQDTLTTQNISRKMLIKNLTVCENYLTQLDNVPSLMQRQLGRIEFKSTKKAQEGADSSSFKVSDDKNTLEVFNRKRPHVEDLLNYEDARSIPCVKDIYDAYAYTKRVKLQSSFVVKAFSGILSVSFPSLKKKIRSVGSSGAERLSGLDDIINWLSAFEPKMDVKKVSSPTGILGVDVVMQGVFKAHISLQLRTGGNYRLMVSKVAMCGTNEHINVWGASKYVIFRRFTAISNSAWLYFLQHQQDSAFSSFLQWIHSYHNLFMAQCCVCKRHLAFDPKDNGLLPPIYHSFGSRDSKPYHYQCL